MPSQCGYTWPDELDLIIREETARAGVPLDIAYALIAAESSFDPSARNLTAVEDSVGLLQLNRIGGQGEGYSVEELKDPRRNLQIGLPPIARAIAQTWSADIEPYEYIYLVATRSGHPGPVDRYDDRIIHIAHLWSCFWQGVGVFGSGGMPSDVSGPGPGLALAAATVPLLLFLIFPAGLLRHLLPILNPATQLRAAAMAVTPGGITRNLQWAMDPSRILTLPTERLGIRLRTRLPPRHRPARGRPGFWG